LDNNDPSPLHGKDQRDERPRFLLIDVELDDPLVLANDLFYEAQDQNQGSSLWSAELLKSRLKVDERLFITRESNQDLKVFSISLRDFLSYLRWV